jgi:hypothetical protein
VLSLKCPDWLALPRGLRGAARFAWTVDGWTKRPKGTSPGGSPMSVRSFDHGWTTPEVGS